MTDSNFTGEDAIKIVNELVEAVEEYKAGNMTHTELGIRCMVLAQDAENYGLKHPSKCTVG